MPRIIYSLQLDLDPTATGEVLQLIAPLDAHGRSPHIRPHPPKKRAVDLRPGDWPRHRGRPFRVWAMRAYREHWVSEEQVGSGELRLDGYVVAGHHRNELSLNHPAQIRLGKVLRRLGNRSVGQRRVFRSPVGGSEAALERPFPCAVAGSGSEKLRYPGSDGRIRVAPGGQCKQRGRGRPCPRERHVSGPERWELSWL